VFAVRFPNPLVLLVGCTLVAAAMTYVVPAGEYDRHDDAATGRSIVVAGTYHHVPAEPVGLFGALVGIPRGIIDAASVIAFVFLVGGAFGVVDRTGALHEGIDWLVRRLGTRGIVAIPIVSLAFATGGVLENMQEEIIALVPALLLLTQRLGFDATTAVLISLGAATVGSAFSPVNPFQVLIAQKVAHLPQASGSGFRTVALLLALALWIAGTMRYAQRTRKSVGVGAPSDAVPSDAAPGDTVPRGRRGGLVIAIVLATFAFFVYGVLRLGWDFDQEAALFFAMGIAAGLVGGLRIAGTADAFIDGFRSMTLAALLIGVARGISVVMKEGHIIDTVVQALAAPLAKLPVGVAALGMMAVQAIIHVPVPSASGEAVLTIPILAPVSDLIGLSRQVTVLTYQYGAGLCELLTPTNGALMAVLAAANVRFEDWLRAATRITLVLAALGAVAIVIAVAVKLS
jgi:uncharacterized ion transporter superfamily protein YfcC